MSLLSPKCTLCRKRSYIPPCILKARNAGGRRLVDLTLTDSDLGLAERKQRQHIYEMEREAFEYHTGRPITRREQ